MTLLSPKEDKKDPISVLKLIPKQCVLELNKRNRNEWECASFIIHVKDTIYSYVFLTFMIVPLRKLLLKR